MTTKIKPPRLSVNKLGEYMTANAGRQNKILYDAKHPQDYITPFYRDAAEAIAKAIAEGLEDASALERAIKLLGEKKPNTVNDIRRLAGNIDAIETFIDIMGDVDLKGVDAKLGAHQANHLVVRGVEISVRPEVTLHPKKRNGEPVGWRGKAPLPQHVPAQRRCCGLHFGLRANVCPGSPRPAWSAEPGSLLCDRYVQREGLSRSEGHKGAHEGR